MLNPNICQQARLSRDPRFDGKFFIAVKTTGIFCRTICPARLPLEKNVEYFETAHDALQAGFRPCLRCHPDSLPNSAQWDNKRYRLNKIIRLLESGEVEDKKLYQLSNELDITPRYLRKIFAEQFGLSPKKYQLHYKCALAKQLLEETLLPIGEIAYACEFSSISLFNNTFKAHFGFTPGSLRKQASSVNKHESVPQHIRLTLRYQSNYDWSAFLKFQQLRLIDGLETINGQSYQRNIIYQGVKGSFSMTPHPKEHAFYVTISLDEWRVLSAVLTNIRRMFDLDTNLSAIERLIKQKLPDFPLHSGLRIPGCWESFEAGIRAICGQQISVVAASKLVTQITQLASEPKPDGGFYFPTTEQLANFDFNPLRTTTRRKETLKLFSEYCHTNEAYNELDNWRSIKGIGSWTIDYAKLRSQGTPDIWLSSDLGIKNALEHYQQTHSAIDIEAFRPWRSYIGLQLWAYQF